MTSSSQDGISAAEKHAPVRILYIDDSETDRELVCRALRSESAGFEIVTALSQEAFCRLLADEEFDLVLSDFHMPGFSGLEVIDLVCQRKPHLPVIIVTGTGSEETAVQAMKRGAADYVIKTPQQVQRLVFTVKAVLEKKRLEQERERAEQRLLEERNLLRTLIDNLPAYIYFKDRDGRYLLNNLPNVRLLGADNEAETFQKTVFDYFPKELARQYAEDDRSVVEFGQSIFNREEQFQDPAGHRGWFSTTKLPLRDFNQQIIGLVGISRDITESRKSEEKLRASEERLKLAFEASEAGFYEHSTDFRTGYVDDRWAAILGFTPAEIPRFNEAPIWWQEKLHPDERENMWHRYLELMDGKIDHFQAECRIQHKSGIYRWVRIMSKPVARQADGRATAVAGIVQDITEEKDAEEQMRRSQKLEAIGLLAGGVAHDFNNILQVIKGYTTLVSESLTADDERQANLVQVKSAADKASQLTRQLLAFGRRQPLSKTDMDLNAVVSQLLKWVRRLIGEHITVQFVPTVGLANVRGDESQVEQVLLNLCVNARDAMPNGGTLTIELKNAQLTNDFCYANPWAMPGEFVCLSVADTGDGMDQQTLARIFEPFFSTKPKEKGTGLGLPVVYGIVNQHEGFLHVLSDVGKGSKFQIYLPVSPRLDETRAHKPDHPITRGHETILLAEDEPAVRQLATTLLRKAGYQVLAVNTGIEAVSAFKQNAQEIRLLILDMVMPQMGGAEAYETIRAQKPGIPVVFCSGYSGTNLLTEYNEFKEVHFLQKPYDVPDLLNKVRRILDQL